MGELESARLDDSRSKIRTIAGTGTKPSRIAQGRIRSARTEGRMNSEEVYVGVEVSKERLDVAVRPSGEFFAEANDKRGEPSGQTALATGVHAGSDGSHRRCWGSSPARGSHGQHSGPCWIWIPRCSSAMGRQEGTLKGSNPCKHGRPSRHPLLVILAEAKLVRLPPDFWLYAVHADSGFSLRELLEESGRRTLPYVIAVRMNPPRRRTVAAVR
jgi:hypothetical protein